MVADRYRLDSALGRGAMGEVWRATDETLGRDVAVKLLRTDEAAETDGERFRQEAQTAARLNHPHVVSVYDFGSHYGQLYLVMELVDGWSLAQERSLRGILDAQETARIGAQMAAGLAAAHRQGVIHRDIKPANVMLTADRAVKIADFGIARFADDAAATLTATGAILGTSAYLAPERALGRPAQPASDMYALGCVLYELLTGRPPPVHRRHHPGRGSSARRRRARPALPAAPRDTRADRRLHPRSAGEGPGATPHRRPGRRLAGQPTRAHTLGPARRARHGRHAGAPSRGTSPARRRPPHGTAASWQALRSLTQSAARRRRHRLVRRVDAHRDGTGIG
nr:serine/threonine-protein kinase [Streptomyces cupreus]